jgi:hypothetical protein
MCYALKSSQKGADGALGGDELGVDVAGERGTFVFNEGSDACGDVTQRRRNGVEFS